MLDRLGVLNSKDPSVKALIEAAIEAGDYDRADLLFQQADAADLAAGRRAQELAQQDQAAADKHFLNAAAARAGRGRISLIRLNYLEAAAHFKAASEIVPLSYPQVKGEYLRSQADALSTYGEQKGDNAALHQAITIYQEVLGILAHAQVPLDWAATQNNLGLALATLGERRHSSELLRQAEAAIQSAYAAVKEAGYHQYDKYFEERFRAVRQLIETYSNRASSP